MNIENAVFKKCSVDFDKLLKIGFIKENESYKYSKIFMNDNFRADIYIKLDGKLQSKVIELKFNEEYSNRHMKNSIGKFSNGVKEEYIAILKQYKRKNVL